MKVLSLFDGISCGRVAFERAGLCVSRYVAYEIDQDAINVSAWNWEDIKHKGSVEGADFSQYKGFDIVIGGFPCTDLSIGKNNRQGLKGQHSRLFWEQVRAIKEINPRYFLVENNYRMPKADEAIITETLGVSPIHINSAKVSAQNRDRLYWTNIPNVSQPEDKKIKLIDILQPIVKAKYQGIVQTPRSYNKGNLHVEKSPTLTAGSFPHNNRLLIGPMEIYKEKAYCLTASYDGAIWWNTLQRHQRELVAYKCNQGVEVYNGLIVFGDKKIKTHLPDGRYVFRKLTPVECERLQTLPDNYTEMVSDTQRYRQLGNGWTVDVIAHIFNHIHLDDLL